MKKIVSKTIFLTVPSMPPQTDFIEKEFKKMKLDVIRWAIIDVRENELTLSVCVFS